MQPDRKTKTIAIEINRLVNVVNDIDLLGNV
jgi:hypothetical protein